jgi:DNA-binding GntR family transcriptional regulator
MQDELDILTKKIAEDLRAGLYPPGTWLKQVDLQARYGVRRAAVRKALESLAGRRLIRHEQNRGFSAHPADSDETKQILELRLAIETGYAAQMVEKASADDIIRLTALAEGFEAALKRGAFAELHDTNRQFHRALLDCAQSPVMVATVEELRLRTAPALTTQWMNLPRIALSSAEHFEMIEALAECDAPKLAGLIARHIRQTP